MKLQFSCNLVFALKKSNYVPLILLFLLKMKPRCLLQLTTKFKTFILNVPYVAVAKYGDREIKVRGTWRGYSVADPELNKPINEPHYFDLETGEELNYSLSFDPERKIYVTK